MAHLDRLQQKEAAETDRQLAIRVRLNRIISMRSSSGFRSIFDVALARTSFVELEALQEAVTGSAVSEEVRGVLADQSETVEEIRADTTSLRRALNDLGRGIASEAQLFSLPSANSTKAI
jgi:hypothetical protein